MTARLTGEREHTTAAGKRWGRLPKAAALILAAVVVAAGSGYLAARLTNGGPAAEQRPAGIPAVISTSLANTMGLNSLPVKAAPGFTFTDQHGHTMSLSELRGKVVVLEFMDDHCTDICPIVSQEFVNAYHELGAEAGKVVFAAINVNPFYRSVSAVMTFTTEHRLNTIPDWHYFTGPLPALETAWHHYSITVTAPSRNNIIHTSAVYFIDPQGQERYMADADIEEPSIKYTKSGTAYVPAGQETAWAQGIAELARLLAR